MLEKTIFSLSRMAVFKSSPRAAKCLRPALIRNPFFVEVPIFLIPSIFLINVADPLMRCDLKLASSLPPGTTRSMIESANQTPGRKFVFRPSSVRWLFFWLSLFPTISPPLPPLPLNNFYRIHYKITSLFFCKCTRSFFLSQLTVF